MAKNTNRPFGLRDKFSYMMGDVGCNIVLTMANSYLLIFYTKVMGVSAGIVGTLFMLAHFVDAFTDMAVGRIVDTRSFKNGDRFRPWIALGSIPLVISSILMYNHFLADAEGFEFILTKAQWQGALDFCKAVNAQILVSVANCWGVHENGTGAWQPDQAKLLWDYTAQQGMTIDYAEFMNEPNLLSNMMLPEGYGPAEFGRDHDLFAKWLKENHPETKLVGPCAADSPRGAMMGGTMLNMVTTATLFYAEGIDTGGSIEYNKTNDAKR